MEISWNFVSLKKWEPCADCDPLIDRLSLSVLYCCDDLILSRNDQPVCVSPGISVYMIIIGRKSL